MRNVFHISLLLCLLGLTSNIYYSADQRSFNFYSGNETGDVHSSWGDNDSAIFAAPNPFLFVAETSGNSYSEIDPRTSASANLTSTQDTGLSQTLYIHHTEHIFISHSVRTLIYPFHSFL
ncbi:hypothetical protein BH23BAC3_BH23BAC3_35230 [soil metagenome]